MKSMVVVSLILQRTSIINNTIKGASGIAFYTNDA